MSDADSFERRTRDAQQRLRDRGDAGLVLFPSRNLRYLAGYAEEPAERHLLLFVPAEGDPVFFVPALSGEQIHDASWVADVRTWADAENPVPRIAAIAEELDLAGGHLLVDDTMWALFTQDLRSALPESTFGLASEVVGDLRVRKDEAELDAMRRAGAVADETVRDLRTMGEEVLGLTEAELAAEIEELLEANGGTGVSFATIVGAGPNGAKPHHHHSDREITPGEPVVLDFGTRVDGYPSDQTRTLVFGGEPSEAVQEVHEVVEEAQQAGVEAVEPGVTAEAVDAAAREVIEDAGYGEEFIHRTGHGVGLDVHEEPYIVEGNDRELEPGMVFSVEPGIYLPGEFGVRIEDLVVVTEDGCERLNETDRGWRC
ncbi:M24 family metallopeptidase [Halolamina salifodinae]|uniref:Xaa-Pro aminopeptidase n=1 Tax=Halolamina salifodinae TaxID=1202767 RepID=A0A8T4GY22_9EURY|nr:Xaa-Pro peptidase family protein [Halolamina salifodinae]MBP1987112.1 Xaa-Pro aminopeptidase [Halolamina salifodinae]